MSKFSCPFPENLNPLSPNGFQLVIDRLPGVVFFAQTVQLPTVTTAESIFDTPLSMIRVPGEKLSFSDLNIQFLVDERMENYKQVYEWMQGFAFPDDNEQYNDFIMNSPQPNLSELSKMYSDARLIVLGNNLQPIQTLLFKDTYPSNLNMSTQFTVQAQDVEYLTASLDLAFSTFTFEVQEDL